MSAQSAAAWVELLALFRRRRHALPQGKIARALGWTPGTTARRVRAWKAIGLLSQERAGVWPTALPSSELPLPGQLPLPITSKK